jgi:hypothetical protein
VYQPLLQELCAYIPAAIRSIAAIEMTKAWRGSHSVEAIRAKIQTLIGEIFFDSDGWILLAPHEQNFEIVAQSDNVKPDLQALIGWNPKIDGRKSILGAVRDNKTILYTVGTITSRAGSVRVKRALPEDAGAEAFFSDGFEEARQELGDKERYILEIGSKESLAQTERNRKTSGIAIIVGPIIFPTGLPVGVLAVARTQAITDEQADRFQVAIQTLAAPLWVLAKKPGG